LYYEKCKNVREVHRPEVSDEKYIEAVVTRILRDRERSGTVSVPAGQVEISSAHQPQYDVDITFDEAAEALGTDGFNAVVNTLDMFRKK
jgi:hypothetical protein